MVLTDSHLSNHERASWLYLQRVHIGTGTGSTGPYLLRYELPCSYAVGSRIIACDGGATHVVDEPLGANDTPTPTHVI